YNLRLVLAWLRTILRAILPALLQALANAASPQTSFLTGDFLFSATEVPNGKPAPDLFLHAASRMGARTAECIVIEDSPAGVSAATAAGMAAVGFVGGSHADAELGAQLKSAGGRAGRAPPSPFKG